MRGCRTVDYSPLRATNVRAEPFSSGVASPARTNRERRARDSQSDLAARNFFIGFFGSRAVTESSGRGQCPLNVSSVPMAGFVNINNFNRSVLSHQSTRASETLEKLPAGGAISA